MKILEKATKLTKPRIIKLISIQIYYSLFGWDIVSQHIFNFCVLCEFLLVRMEATSVIS